MVSAIAMLHLGAERAHACEAHAGDAALAERSAPAGHEHHAAAPSDSEQTPEQPCSDRTPSDCCVGMTSCSGMLAFDTDGVSDEPVTHATVAVAAPAAPHSRPTAPEPPPPRG